MGELVGGSAAWDRGEVVIVPPQTSVIVVLLGTAERRDKDVHAWIIQLYFPSASTSMTRPSRVCPPELG